MINRPPEETISGGFVQHQLDSYDAVIVLRPPKTLQDFAYWLADSISAGIRKALGR